VEYAVKKQNILGDKDRQLKVLSLVSDEDILFTSPLQSRVGYTC